MPKKKQYMQKDMKPKKENNYAFIDGVNLNLGIQELGWKIDYNRPRRYLKDKYQVEYAYYFIGYLPAMSDLYNSLQKSGYILVFKPTLKKPDGTIKGNCDAELVLQSMIDYKKYDKAVIVSGDGDFACLVKYLNEQNKLKCLIVPNRLKYSALLKKPAEKRLASLDVLKKKLEYKKKRTP
jgi:uncharacterized LabA/DUF88 family protein